MATDLPSPPQGALYERPISKITVTEACAAFEPVSSSIVATCFPGMENNPQGEQRLGIFGGPIYVMLLSMIKSGQSASSNPKVEQVVSQTHVPYVLYTACEISRNLPKIITQLQDYTVRPGPLSCYPGSEAQWLREQIRHLNIDDLAHLTNSAGMNVGLQLDTNEVDVCGCTALIRSLSSDPNRSAVVIENYAGDTALTRSKVSMQTNGAVISSMDMWAMGNMACDILGIKDRNLVDIFNRSLIGAGIVSLTRPYVPAFYMLKGNK